MTLLKMRLHHKLKLERLSPTQLQVRLGLVQKRVALRQPSVLDAIQRLAEREYSEAELMALVGDEDQTRLYYALNQLHQMCLVWYTLYDEAGQALATFRPYSPDFAPKRVRLADDLPLGLSRFALCRRLEEETILECPLATAQIIVHQPALLMPLWGTPLTSQQYRATVQTEAAAAFWGMLYHSGFLTPHAAEDQDPRLYQWTFHDLLFHQMSRVNQYQVLLGTPRSCPTHIPFQPVFPPPLSEQVIPLPQPDLAQLRQADPPFVEVVEKRSTTRHYNDDAPITLAQLGELLFRAARATSDVIPATPDLPYDVSRRAYGGGGRCYELEIYLAVRLCEGLDSGFYHYRPFEHTLEYLSPPTPALAALLDQTCVALRQPAPAQIQMTFTARFQRVSWKYDPIAYALILKNTGVLMHQLALAASAMNLGFAPLGSGHTETFFALLPACDPLQQAPVGEAALGSPIPRF